MPRFLNTRGRSPIAIGICDRCHLKFPLASLGPDPNYPGLRVCRQDRDQFDPWRLPARTPENISLPFYRPDVSLVFSTPAGASIERVTEDDAVRVTEDEDIRVTQDSTDILPP